MMNRRNLLRLAALSPLAAPALAQTDVWPSRPVKLVVPWPAGGPTDTYGRALARELSAQFGQPFVVDNRTGATGTVGIQYVARSAADGYTLLVPNLTAFIGSVVALGETVQFDPLRDFTPIGIFVESSSILWAHPALGISNFDALLARARDASKPRLAFGTTGSGSVSEQAVEQLARHYALELVKVPYRGTAPQVTDLVAGHVQIGSADYPTAGPHHRDGRLRPLLVIGRHRLPELPDVPTTAELGLTEPDFTVWNGFFAPAATPQAIVERLREGLANATRSEAFRAVTDGNGNRAVLQTGAEVTARLEQELASRRAFARGIVSVGG
ncbi:tripartite tricarboxylate transporter substrate binding protein [Roseococcus sp. YIM B11640]|uniref:tripartite tricarboxylate transporter substrate binding protein n=1 Tax=Roseococcus sp. YIM B11640 TaxID=3133973 RepID=UPI003C7B2179